MKNHRRLVALLARAVFSGSGVDLTLAVRRSNAAGNNWPVVCEPLEQRVMLSLPAATPTSVPRPDHVVVVLEENHAYNEIIGSASAPYINSLAQSSAVFSSSFAVTHPSQPNYLALFSGSTQGTTSDTVPTTVYTTPNLGAEALGAGLSFAGYSESLPSVGFLGDSSTTVSGQNQYERKHNPWSDWQNDTNPTSTQLPSSVNEAFTSFPTDFSQLPTVSFVVPNEQNDMHDGTIAQGDTWLQTNMDAYAQWAKTHNSLLIITWDEDDSSESNQIPTIFAGAGITPGTYSETINHYNVLSTIEDMYGLPLAGSSSTATPITDIWTTSEKLGITSAAQKLTAGVKSSTITIQLQNAAGTPINATGAGQVVTLGTSSGGGIFQDAGNNTITSITIAAGTSTASFTYKDTLAGSPTITASAVGMTSATQSETVNAAAASQIIFTTAAQTLSAGVASGTMTVELEDLFGNVAKAGTSGQVINLGSTSGTGVFTPASVTVAADTSTISFTYKDSTAGTPTITASATGLTSATQQETVNPATGTLPAGWTDADIGTPGKAGSAQYNTAAAVWTVAGGGADIWGAADQFNFASESFTGDGSIIAQVTSITNTDANAKGGVMFRNDGTAGSPFVAVVATSASGLIFEWRTTAGGAAASTHATGINVPVWLKLTRSGNNFTAFYSANSGSTWIQIGAAHTVTMGTAALAGLAVSAHNNTLLNTTTFANVSVQNQVVLQPTQLSFSTAAQTLIAGVASGTITIQLKDQNGALINATANVTVNLASTSSTGTFTPTSLTIAAGTSAASFTYKDTTVGRPTITASATGLTSASQQETVNAATASQIVFNTVAQTLSAGVVSGTITIQLKDLSSNPVNAGASGQIVNLSSNSGTGVFLNAGNTVITSVTVVAGASTASFTYKDTAAGTPTLTASATGLTSATQLETVNAAVASQIAFITAAQTTTVGVASGTITVELKDAFGNVAKAGANGQAINLGGTSGTGTFTPASVTIAAGSSTASFTYTDTTAGTPTITASAIGLISATQLETVTAASGTLPAGWMDADIGAPGKTGSASFNSGTGTWTVGGSGADIWGNADQFNFASRSLSGDGSITAQVTSLTNTNANAKAGIMFRNDASAGSPFVAVVETPAGGLIFEWRTTAGGASASTHVTGVTGPVTLKLTRTGNSFTAWYSTNGGSTWIQIGAAHTVAMGTSALAGLAVTSHDNTKLNTAMFSNVLVG